MTTINTPSFSKLKRVPLREHFPNEARDFTPYLEENIDALSDELGLSLEVIQREAPVGDLSLDLLATDMENSNIVIIENQLEKADHTHLGQLLAYAAGLDAKIVIWISDEFRDEYIQVLKWLNEQTHTEINFFAIAVELLQIEDSPIALNFRQVVVINHQEQYVDGDKHTNTIEGFWSLLKRAWYGQHHHYSTGYTPLYVAERCYVYNNRHLEEDGSIFWKFIKQSVVLAKKGEGNV